jgi:hypothetical protein
MSGALYLAGSGHAWAADCENKLGNNYDQQSLVEKKARLNLFLDCRYRTDFQSLKAAHKQALKAVQSWSLRTRKVTNSSLATKRPIARHELKIAQQTAIGEFKADYARQFDELEATRTPDNKPEVALAKKDLVKSRRADKKALVHEHREQVTQLRDCYNQCTKTVDSQIDQMAIEDTENMNRQRLKKSSGLDAEYRALKDTPMSMAPRESTSSPERAASVQAAPGSPIYQNDLLETDADSSCNIVFDDGTNFQVSDNARLEMDEYVFDPSEGDEKKHSLLRRVFLFTSGLIGRKEANDVEIKPLVYGSIGIRG